MLPDSSWEAFKRMIIFHFHATLHLFSPSVFLTTARLAGQIRALTVHDKQQQDGQKHLTFPPKTSPMWRFFQSQLFIMFRAQRQRLEELLRIKEL